MAIIRGCAGWRLGGRQLGRAEGEGAEGDAPPESEATAFSEEGSAVPCACARGWLAGTRAHAGGWRARVRTWVVGGHACARGCAPCAPRSPRAFEAGASVEIHAFVCEARGVRPEPRAVTAAGPSPSAPRVCAQAAQTRARPQVGAPKRLKIHPTGPCGSTFWFMCRSPAVPHHTKIN